MFTGKRACKHTGNAMRLGLGYSYWVKRAYHNALKYQVKTVKCGNRTSRAEI